MRKQIILQRRHFELIAATLKQAAMSAEFNPAYQDQADRTSRLFADKLAACNVQFDRGRFLKACGVL